MLTIMQNNFNEFKTEKRSLKYFENSNCLIKPQAISINAAIIPRLVGVKRQAMISDINIQVVPMKKV